MKLIGQKATLKILFLTVLMMNCDFNLNKSTTIFANEPLGDESEFINNKKRLKIEEFLFRDPLFREKFLNLKTKRLGKRNFTYYLEPTQENGQNADALKGPFCIEKEDKKDSQKRDWYPFEIDGIQVGCLDLNGKPESKKIAWSKVAQILNTGEVDEKGNQIKNPLEKAKLYCRQLSKRLSEENENNSSISTKRWRVPSLEEFRYVLHEEGSRYLGDREDGLLQNVPDTSSKAFIYNEGRRGKMSFSKNLLMESVFSDIGKDVGDKGFETFIKERLGIQLDMLTLVKLTSSSFPELLLLPVTSGSWWLNSTQKATPEKQGFDQLKNSIIEDIETVDFDKLHVICVTELEM